VCRRNATAFREFWRGFGAWPRFPFLAPNFAEGKPKWHTRREHPKQLATVLFIGVFERERMFF
jgi:hypothetical protein